MAIPLEMLIKGDELHRRVLLPYIIHITRHIHEDASESGRQGNFYRGKYSAIETGRTVGSFRVTDSRNNRRFSQPNVGARERRRLRKLYPEEVRYKRRVIFPIRPFRLSRIELAATVSGIFAKRLNVVVRNDANYRGRGLIGLRIVSPTVRRPLLEPSNREALLSQAVARAAADYRTSER